MGTREVLSLNTKDLPFTLTYLFAENGSRRLLCASGIGLDHPLAIERIEVGSDFPFPANQVLTDSAVRPEAIAVMREVGIDISGHRSKNADEFAGQNFDYVITVCHHANEVCPVFPGKTMRLHRSFEDPPPVTVGAEEERTAIFRQAREKIRIYLAEFASAVN